MGKFDGVLLASDFDDTLYGLDRQVCPRNRKALDYFIAQGGRFTVATGRAHTTFAPYVHLAPINAPVVLSNGSAIYDFQQERFLVQTLLNPRAPEDMAALTAAIPELGFEAYHGEDIYVYNFNAVTAGHMKKVGTTYTQCPIAQMPTPWGKVILQQEHDVLLRARAWLLEHCPERYEAVFSNRYYLELTDRGSTKGSMVARLADMLGIGAGKYLLRRGQSERHLHAAAVRHPLRPRQLRPRGAPVGRPHPVPLQRRPDGGHRGDPGPEVSRPARAEPLPYGV